MTWLIGIGVVLSDILLVAPAFAFILLLVLAVVVFSLVNEGPSQFTVSNTSPVPIISQTLKSLVQFALGGQLRTFTILLGVLSLGIAFALVVFGPSSAVTLAVIYLIFTFLVRSMSVL